MQKGMISSHSSRSVFYSQTEASSSLPQASPGPLSFHGCRAERGSDSIPDLSAWPPYLEASTPRRGLDLAPFTAGKRGRCVWPSRARSPAPAQLAAGSTLIRGPRASLTSLKGTDHPSEQSPRQCGPALAAGKEPHALAPGLGPELHQGPHPLLPCVTSRSGGGSREPRVHTPLPEGHRGFFLTSHPTFNNCPRGRCWNLDTDSPPGHSQAHHKSGQWSHRPGWALPLEPLPGWALPLELRPWGGPRGRASSSSARAGWGGEGGLPEAPRSPRAPYPSAALHPMGGPSCPHSSVLKVTLPHCLKTALRCQAMQSSFQRLDSALLVGFARISNKSLLSFSSLCSQLSNVLIIFSGLGPQD